MAQSEPALRGFKAVFMTIGAVYVLLASSMLVRGAGVMLDFEVPDSLVREPVFEDFFLFFYQLMAAVGLLMLLFGHVTRGRKHQQLVARVFCLLNVLITLRDLYTSDSPLGNHLYRGSATLIPVAFDLVFALAFGMLSFRKAPI
jgi:hypothetical protein